MEKTNAMRLLDARKVAYRVTVYKTLVVLRDPSASLRAGSPGKTRPILVMMPAQREVGLKRLAKELGEKKLRMATQREAEQLTGLQAGGISALALLNRGFDVYLDASAQGVEKVSVLNLQVAEVDPENHVLLVRGAVPGAPGGLITVRPSIKGRKPAPVVRVQERIEGKAAKKKTAGTPAAAPAAPAVK